MTTTKTKVQSRRRRGRRRWFSQYLSFIQSLYFGLAGYKLSLLLLSKYLEKQHQQYSEFSVGNATKDDSMEGILINTRHQELATEILSTHIPSFLPIMSDNSPTRLDEFICSSIGCYKDARKAVIKLYIINIFDEP